MTPVQKIRILLPAIGLSTLLLADTATAQPIGPLSPAQPSPVPRMQRIADTQTAVPGGAGTFSLFADARCIDGNRVAFVGYDSGSGSGIYTFRNGVLDVLVDENSDVPGTSNKFQIFFDVSMDGGVVAFTGGWAGPGGGCAFSGSEGLLTAPFSGGPIVPVHSSLTTPYHCFHGLEYEDGVMVVCAGINPVDNIHNHSESILATTGGSLSTLVDVTTPAPGGGTFTGFDQEVVHRDGAYLFAEILHNTIGAVAGLYADRNDGQGLRLVANASTPIPGGTGNFASFASMDCDGGEVAFVGRDGSNRTALYAGTSPQDLRVVVNNTTPVPGTPFNFLGLSNPMAYGNGVMAFSGYWAGGGIGLFIHRNGGVEAILKKGDLLDGSVVEQAYCRTRQISGRWMLVEVRFQSSPPLSHRALYLVSL